MNNWNQLFVRHGWLLESVESDVFCCKNETEGNLEFLFDGFKKANINFTYNNGKLSILDEPISEEELIDALDFKHRGRGEGLWFQAGEEEPKVQELDTYICGVVRQLNRLHFYTMGSCDGHGRRAAHVMISKDSNIEQLSELLVALGLKHVHYRESRNAYHLHLPLNQQQLLDFAEDLSHVEEDWLGEGYDIKEQLFRHLLEQLLMIPGSSGAEGQIRDFVKEKLTPFVDHIIVDHAGNILAEKTYRSGHGPTILLNAHLDTVHGFEKDRKLIKDGTIWSSSKGILGADDRAGVAVVLHLAKTLFRQSYFSGKVKFIFTVEEECGLVGARKVDEYFLWGTDAAIVVDRRGTGDIVTTCGGFYQFCHPQYGSFFESTAVAEGLNDWSVTAGGSSDTRIWAMHGIQSVNLSAGYQNEHTDQEFIDVEACYETTKLIKAIFRKSRELSDVLREIRREEQRKVILKDAQ